MGKKILLLAYPVSPTRGSEFSVAWNYINEMSKDNSIVVLYGVSGKHLGDMEEIENWRKTNSIQNVRFVPVPPNGLTERLNYLNRRAILPAAFYIAFRSWQWQAYQKATELIKTETFDLVHYLNPIGYREPGYLWKLGLPYMWGPIGGMPNLPARLFKTLSFRARIAFIIKNLANTVQINFNMRLNKAISSTDLLLAATSENQLMIWKKFNKPAIYFPENGIINSDFYLNTNILSYKKGDLFKLIWIGSIDARKSLILLLEALSKIGSKNWQLDIVGDGPLAPAMHEFAHERQINKRVNWHGYINRPEVMRLLQFAHTHVITSIREGNPTVLLEAMTRGVPSITLNHCGMKDVVCGKCGIKIEVQSYDQIITDLAEAIYELINSPEEVNRLSAGVRECAMHHSWDNRRMALNTFYDLAIKNHKNRQKNN
jgi:glycosyltransferase involved in cell wall biosynthesis